jgi:fused signal recognition particle receptor
MTPILIAVAVIVLVAIVAIVASRLRKPDGATTRSQAPAAPQAPSAAPQKPRQGDGLAAKVRSLFSGGATEDAWAGLEGLLVKADVGPVAAADLVARVRADTDSGVDPAEALRREVEAILGGDTELRLPQGELSVVMVVGVNGTGKTTTIGKLAGILAAQGKKVTLAGSDTFRAAAGEQLETWAQRSGSQIVKQDRGADPGSVAFDGVKSAQAKGSDVLIVDTAGRLHTRTPLMDELGKVRRVLVKAAGREPDEVLLVLDATTGQNGIAQARVFTEAVGVTGIALTKMDGTAKGGIVLAVREELGVPVKLVGTGEGAGDLEFFDARSFAERLVGA